MVKENVTGTIIIECQNPSQVLLNIHVSYKT